MNRRTFVAVPFVAGMLPAVQAQSRPRRRTHRLYIQRTGAGRVSRQVDLRIALLHGQPGPADAGALVQRTHGLLAAEQGL